MEGGAVAARGTAVATGVGVGTGVATGVGVGTAVATGVAVGTWVASAQAVTTSNSTRSNRDRLALRGKARLITSSGKR